MLKSTNYKWVVIELRNTKTVLWYSLKEDPMLHHGDTFSIAWHAMKVDRIRYRIEPSGTLKVYNCTLVRGRLCKTSVEKLMKSDGDWKMHKP